MVSTEVLVIGGGVTGVSLLHWLDRAGISAELVERERLAAGASGRNAGFLIAGVAANYRDAIKAYGRDRAREIWAFTIDNHSMLRDAVRNAEVGYQQRGSWTLAASDAEAKALRESETLMREDGLDASWSDECGYAAAGYVGGLLNPGDGAIDAVAACAALARPYFDRIRAGVTVQRVEPSGTHVSIETSAGELSASTVILATNAYTGTLAPSLPVRPVRGQMLATEPLDKLVAERPVYAAHGYRYWRQLDDRSLMLGGFRDAALDDEVGFDDSPTAQIQDQLDTHLQLIAPGARVARRWAGIMGFTPDHLPLVGPVPGADRVHVCGGYSGHGLNFSFVAARLLVHHIASGNALPTWMDPARFSAGSD